MATRYLYTDGMKSIDLNQYPNSAWTWYTGRPTSGEDEILTRVAWVYRAVNLISQTLADTPFAVVKGETDTDTSDDWANKLGFMPDPKRLFWLVAASLQLYGKAYLLKERTGKNGSGAVKNIRFLDPTSIEPEYDPNAASIDKAIKSFKRHATGRDVVLQPVSEVMYFWLPDPRVEIGPPTTYPAQAALGASSTLYYIDKFASNFFERGAIKGMLIGVPANTQQAEKERLEKNWQKFMSGVKRAFNFMIINADAIKPVVVGEGLEALKDAGAIRRSREDIAAAFGISLAMILSSEANFATAVQDKKNLYENTVMPLASFIAEVFNAQLFSDTGHKLEFRPDGLDVFQTDENERAGAFATYVNAGMKPSVAGEMLGLELPQGVEYKDLDPEEPPEQLQEAAQEQPAEEEPEDDEEEQRELAQFQRKALRLFKSGRIAEIEFDCGHIQPARYMAIIDTLHKATSEDEVKAAFHVETPAVMPDAAHVLEGLRLAVEAMKGSDNV